MSTPLLILYAAVTGNAEICANRIADASRSLGYHSQVWSVDGYDVRQLANQQAVLFVVSTYGEGEPPDQATEFWDDLQRFSGSLGNPGLDQGASSAPSGCSSVIWHKCRSRAATTLMPPPGNRRLVRTALGAPQGKRVPTSGPSVGKIAN